ncbi:hypothetical protein RFI_23157 [Reticulomyxa filosa]|uniref:Uncharacterized protein n=1 Tax=Reticulomyxa filosa TaxID=46433 RepID=X6ML76_RETFI|nr:hypothetical protein RFI_23157 [Reticulomyxa filosa]|eukprot:ETO14212.1 hypothetical protein RFI_23157 [Reticulomyxa filosa]
MMKQIKHNLKKKKKKKVPQTISDLSPELLQKARAGLQMENKAYREQLDRLQQEIEKLREASQIKEERLNKVLQKSDEIEMECDKLMSQQEMLEENIEGLTREKKMLEREREETGKQLQTAKQQAEELKKRMEQTQRETEHRVHLVRAEEAKKASDFVMEAQKQIQAFKRNQTRKDSTNPSNTNAVGKLRDKYVQDMKAQQRSAQLQELKMKEFEEEMIEQINTIRFEYMKLKTAYENKSEDYERVQEQITQKDDEIRGLNIELMRKDEKIKQQNNDLQEFGKMKKETDKIHSERYQKAQNSIHKLKLQLKKLQRKDSESSAKPTLASNSSNWQQLGYPEPKSDVTSLIEMKRKQTVVVPLRGGGGKNKPSPRDEPPSTHAPKFINKQDVTKANINAFDLKRPIISNGAQAEIFSDNIPNTLSSPTQESLEDPRFVFFVYLHCLFFFLT